MTELIHGLVWKDGNPEIEVTGELVRCKDCKYWKPWNNGNGECRLHGEDIDFDIEVSPTDYCSFGRRRDE